MNTGRSDEDLKRLFEEEGRLEAPRTPPLARILQGRVRRRVRVLPTGRWAVTAVAVVLAVVISIPVREHFQSRQNKSPIERPMNTSQGLPERKDPISPKEETIMNRPTNKKASSNPIYAMALSVLFLPSGLLGQSAPSPADPASSPVSAEKKTDLSYLKDSLSDFIADRTEEKRDVFPDNVVAILFKRINRADSIPQRIRTFSQTLDTFLSLDKKDLGTPVFHGRYGRRNGEEHFGAPSDFWLMQTQKGTLTALAHDTIRDTSQMVLLNSQNQMTSLQIAATAFDDLPALQIQYDFNGDTVRRISRTEKNSKVENLPFPEGAIIYRIPVVAYSALRGLALREPGDVQNCSAFDLIDSDRDNIATYKVKAECKGKEVVALPCGTFNANHIAITILSEPTGPNGCMVGQVADVWALDNGIILKIRSPQVNEIYLMEYTAPARLEGTIEDPFMKANALAPDTLVKMDVPAYSRENAAWVFTGYSVKAGDRIAFRATGMTRYTTLDEYPALDANGREPDPTSSNIPFICPGAPLAALIGKIACVDKPGEVFTIGKESFYEAKQSGVLYLAVNDQYGASGNNSGSLTTEFMIGNLPPAPPESQAPPKVQKMQQVSRPLPMTVRGVGEAEMPYGVFTPISPDSSGVKTSGPLQPIGSIAGKDLGLICSVSLSPDGRHAYSASAEGNTLCTLERNAETGYLKITQTIQDSRYLRGAIAARVSPDGRYVAVVSCHASSLILFVRDPESGVLVAVDMVLTEDLKDRPLNFPTDCEFSPDSRFLYVISGRSNAVSAFKVVEPGKLEWIDTKVGPNGVFGNMRGIVFSPDGQSIYLASVQGNSLVTMTRDLQSGKMEFLQTIKDGEMGITGLSGSFDVTCSPDGKYVYVCSGRFGGDSAVLAFKVGEDRRLSFLQEILGAPDGPLNYRGGVAIVITQDGRRIFASATLSSTLACFVADPETGRLNLLQTLTPDPKNPRLLNVPNGIACTPDGKFLYITSDDNAIAVYKWNE